MRKFTVLGLLAALGMSGTAFAQNAPSALSYSFIEAGYVHSEIDDADVDGDGFVLEGSYGLTDRFHVFAQYTDLGFDFNIDASSFEVGAGLNWSMAPRLDLVATVSYVSAEVEVRGPGFGRFAVDDDGFGVGLGLRGMLTDQLELGGKIDYVEFDESGDDTTLTGSARYYLTPQLAIGVDIGFDDDGTTWGIGGRFAFGR